MSNHTPILLPELQDTWEERLEALVGLIQRGEGYFNRALQGLYDESPLSQDSLHSPMSWPRFQADMANLATSYHYVSQARHFVFDASQAQVFADLESADYSNLDYRLPFEVIWLQFDAPIKVEILDTPDHLIGMFLRQREETQAEYMETARQAQEKWARLASTNVVILPPLHMDSVEVATTNDLIAVFADAEIMRVPWQGDAEGPFLQQPHTPQVDAWWRYLRNVAVGCVGYINCKNVELKYHDVPAAVNRKRRKKGKRELLPYYTCYVRESDAEADQGGGTSGWHVGYRFDVRGHFRRLPSGETTWVRPHQRGLDHERYIPKTYRVEEDE